MNDTVVQVVTGLSADSYTNYHGLKDDKSIEVLGEADAISRLTIFDKESVVRQAPQFVLGRDAAAEELKSFFLAVNRDYAEVEPVKLLSFEEVVILGEVIHLPRGTEYVALYDSYRPIDRALSDSSLDITSARNSRGKSTSGNRVSFYLGSVGSGNYGHWLVDDLPRLVCALNIIDNPILLYMTSHSAASNTFRQRAVSELFKHREIEVKFIDRHSVVKILDLSYVTPISYHPMVKSRPALEALRHYLQVSEVNSFSKSRLWLSRGSGHGRQVVNEAEALKVAERYGFEPIDLTETSLSRQIGALAMADAVVGVMGAAMANIMFGKSELKSVHLTPSGWIEPFYWDLSDRIGQPYRSLLCNTVHLDRPPHSNDIHVDTSLLAEMLNDLEV